jgi:DNA-binding NtrC family response regulator
MIAERVRILQVSVSTELQTVLRQCAFVSPCIVDKAHSYADAVARLAASPAVSLLLVDVSGPFAAAMAGLRALRSAAPALPIIAAAENASDSLVVESFRSGASEFFDYPAHAGRWQQILRSALDARKQVTAPAPADGGGRGVFRGCSPAMAEIAATLDPVAASDAPVLIQGETGSGKEVLARELHARSPRAGKPFVKLNCAALPSELVESELFGYERGAFTGAFQRKPGMFEAADRGTIFLDEIGDMDVRLQAKLLQVLQGGEFQRIGGKETITVNVRVLAATHQDLQIGIENGRFREDLYYRLNVVNLLLPPLRERKQDIIPLAEILMEKHACSGAPRPPITDSLRAALLECPWPGNVRQLENVVRRLLIFNDPALIARELAKRTQHVPPGRETREAAPPPALVERPPITPLSDLRQARRQGECEAILAALNATHWNRTAAAALLQVEYKALLYKMKKLGIEDLPVKSSATASGRGACA